MVLNRPKINTFFGTVSTIVLMLGFDGTYITDIRGSTWSCRVLGLCRLMLFRFIGLNYWKPHYKNFQCIYGLNYQWKGFWFHHRINVVIMTNSAVYIICLSSCLNSFVYVHQILFHLQSRYQSCEYPHFTNLYTCIIFREISSANSEATKDPAAAKAYSGFLVELADRIPAVLVPCVVTIVGLLEEEVNTLK